MKSSVESEQLSILTKADGGGALPKDAARISGSRDITYAEMMAKKTLLQIVPLFLRRRNADAARELSEAHLVQSGTAVASLC